MRKPFVWLLIPASWMFQASCSSSSGTATNAGDGSTPEASTDSDAGIDSSDEAEADAGPGPSLLRVAHFSPDAPALDLCVAAHGTGAWQGPLFEQAAAEAGAPASASAPGLEYSQVSAYIAIAPGMYDVRIVAAGSGSCTNGLEPTGANTDAGASADAGANTDTGASADAGAAPGASADADTNADADANADASAPVVSTDATNLAFVADESATLLVVGDLAPSGSDAVFRVAMVVDDTTLSAAASLRAINALPGVRLADFGFGSFAGSWLPLITNVAFGSATGVAGPNQGVLDANGYLPITSFGPQLVSVRPSSGASSDIASAAMASVPPGSVATIVAFGRSGESSHPPSLLICSDNQPSGGFLADCSVAQ